MEPFIAALINNPKRPKWLRYIVVTIVCGLLVFLGIALAIKSLMLIGRIFGGLLVALFLVTAIYLFIKIAKSKK